MHLYAHKNAGTAHRQYYVTTGTADDSAPLDVGLDAGLDAGPDPGLSVDSAYTSSLLRVCQGQPRCCRGQTTCSSIHDSQQQQQPCITTKRPDIINNNNNGNRSMSTFGWSCPKYSLHFPHIYPFFTPFPHLNLIRHYFLHLHHICPNKLISTVYKYVCI